MTGGADSSVAHGAGPLSTSLADWMAEKGIGDQKLADALGDTHRSTVSRLRRGVHRPSPELVQRVREVTGGRVVLEAAPAGISPHPHLLPPRPAPVAARKIRAVARRRVGDRGKALDVNEQTDLFERVLVFVCQLHEEGLVELWTLEGRIAAALGVAVMLAAPPSLGDLEAAQP